MGGAVCGAFNSLFTIALSQSASGMAGDWKGTGASPGTPSPTEGAQSLAFGLSREVKCKIKMFKPNKDDI